MRLVLVGLVCATVALTGCSSFEGTAIAAHPPASPFTALLLLDGVSVINSSKTVEDHVISLVTGQDCSLVAASMGQPYCQDNSPPPTRSRTTYCYRSIAAVSCYDRLVDADSGRYVGARVDRVPVAVQ